MPGIAYLPTEIIREVLLYLPISSLLAFGQTSKYHYAVQQISLAKLRLGVFPTRLNGLVSLMESPEETTHSVQIIMEQRKTRNKDMTILNQNVTVSRILHKHYKSLRSLEIALWDLQQSSADALSKLGRLQHLSIRLDHPNTRFLDLPRSFWGKSPGSTVWNCLYSKDQSSPVFGRLESLNLERAGITDYQLLRIINENPTIREIKLQKCLTLTDEFFRELPKSHAGQRLQTLHFLQSDALSIDSRILQYIEGLPALKVSQSALFRSAAVT